MKTAPRVPFVRSRLALSGVAVLLLAAAAVLGADVQRSQSAADQFLRKLAVIEANGFSARPAARRTPVTEAELNSFLAYHARGEIPAGVIDPVVTIDEAGRLSGHAIVDLDEVRKAQAGAGTNGFSVLSLLSGRMPVDATGTLTTRDGTGQFQLETAAANGVPIPKSILQQVVTYYSRTPENPDGIDLDAPFPLPARIREIQTQRGQAVVVQ
jgi:hypothetical protein